MNAHSGTVCGQCARVTEAVLPDLSLAALDYEFPVNSLIQGLKYGGRRVYARVLGELLAIRVHEQCSVAGFALPEVLLPVPLHPWRQLRRGFNQAADIANWLAREHQLPVDCRVLQRQRLTDSQTGLSRSKRLANIRGAFRVVGDIRGKRVAVIDDVVTTGATSGELVKILRHCGAHEVQVWAVARKV